jgi:hypothetical protein
VLGEKATVEVDAPIAYGNEDQWLEARGDQLTRSDQLILLFNLSSTPEAENHGAMLSGIRNRLGTSVELLVLLDESAFVQRHRGQASAQRRFDERLNAWRAVMAVGGVDPVCVRLGDDQDPEATRALEQALLSGRAFA